MGRLPTGGPFPRTELAFLPWLTASSGRGTVAGVAACASAGLPLTKPEKGVGASCVRSNRARVFTYGVLRDVQFFITQCQELSSPFRGCPSRHCDVMVVSALLS